MNEINKLIEVAKAEVGYLEKKSNDKLDSKTANAGKNNYTKYARDLDKIVDFYNGKKNGYAWCDVFVDWCFVKAFGEKRAKELLLQPNKSLGAGCKYSMNYYKNAKQLHDTPKAGDQIFFKKGKSITHTGIVYKVDKTYVYTYEGNTSGAASVVSDGGSVNAKKYKLSNTSIAGYGRPKYKVVEDKKAEIKYVYNCEVLNVRSMPGTTYKENNKTKQVPIVRTIKKGTKVNVYEISGSWSRIGVNEWVSSKYLSKTKPASYPTKTVYNCKTLWVRNKASLLGKKIGSLKKGDKVKVYATKGSWSKIAKDSNKWCSSKYLK